jgi:hypothetical protein
VNSVRVPRCKRIVSARGALRVMVATDRRLLALSPAPETLFAADQALTIFAADETRRMLATADQGKLALWNMGSGSQMAEVELPMSLHERELLGGIGVDGLFFFARGLSSIWRMADNGELHCVVDVGAPLYEAAVFVDGSLGFLAGNQLLAIAVSIVDGLTHQASWDVPVEQIGWQPNGYVGLPNPMLLMSGKPGAEAGPLGAGPIV